MSIEFFALYVQLSEEAQRALDKLTERKADGTKLTKRQVVEKLLLEAVKEKGKR